MDKAKRSIPKAELRKIMKRFLRDSQRGISIELFAQLAGLSASIIKSVFVYEIEPLTEYVQRRVSKAYTEWKNGEVSIMQNRDQTRFVQYRKDAKPVLEKKNSLQLVNGQIKLKIGIENRYDYSKLTLDEQLKRG
jgi:hypothetical protein